MDEFEILEEIGKGGMATIYRGRFKDSGQVIVIKKLHPHLKGDKNFVKRFKREGKILEKLKHKNIITFYGFREIKGEYFILMEYIQGLSLGDILRKNKTPLLIALYITKEIYEGVGYAHKNGIVHRDLKPENVIIGKNGDIKIADFGLAYGSEFPRVTEPGMYVGTPEYIAPEILMGKEYSEMSDIYAIGIILYEMVKGENPFRGKTPYESINKILYRKGMDFGDFPSFLEPIISKTVAMEPKSRYQSIDELKRALNPYITINKRIFKQYLFAPEKFHEEKIIKSKTIKNLRMLALLIVLLITIIFYNYSRRRKHPVVLQTKNIQKVEKKMDTLKVKKHPKNSAKNPITNFIEITGYGWLKVSAVPWAGVYIDDKFIDRTPIGKPIKIASGKHIVIFKHPGRGEVVKTVYLNRGETLKVNVILEYGYLKVVVNPWGYIYIDGKKVAETPIANPIPSIPGVHNLLVVNPGYREWREKINIPRGETLEKHIILKK